MKQLTWGGIGVVYCNEVFGFFMDGVPVAVFHYVKEPVPVPTAVASDEVTKVMTLFSE